MSRVSSIFKTETVYKPFKYPWAVEMAALHEDLHWTEQEAEVGRDVETWKGNLTEPERQIITHILRLFTQSDVAVGHLYVDNLLPVIRNNELRQMLLAFAAREGIHQRAYALVNDTLNLPEEEWSVFLDHEEMRAKWEHMAGISRPKNPETLAYAIAHQVFAEGVSLFGQFIILLQFRLQGAMMGMGEIVKWSIRDESQHAEGLARLFRTLCADHPDVLTDKFKHSIYEAARRVIQLEEAYIDSAFSLGSLKNLTKEETKQYIRFITDRRLLQLGFKALNEEPLDNPCPWVENIVYGRNLPNFFEVRPTEYSNSGLAGDWSECVYK